ncbi:MAG: cupin domain-containing protein [Tepidanaerobacteraceae bacterium]
MIIARAYEIEGYKSPPPFERILKVLISPEIQKDVRNISVGMTLLPPGCKSSSHIHDSEEETWYVLSGRGRVIVGDEEADVCKDTVIVITPGLAHQLVNTGDETFKVLWIYTPPGSEKAVLNQKHV